MTGYEMAAAPRAQIAVEIRTRLTTRYDINHNDEARPIPDSSVSVELPDRPTPHTIIHRWTRVP